MESHLERRINNRKSISNIIDKAGRNVFLSKKGTPSMSCGSNNNYVVVK
jgi:hypothetical protein